MPLFDIIIIAFLMLVAIVLVLAEIFLFPGITLAGVGGLLFAYTSSVMVGNITLGISLSLFVVIFLWMLRSRSFSRVALKTDVDSRLTSSLELGLKPGDKGITVSRLAPMGKIRVGNVVTEAKSRDGFVDENTPIVIVHIESDLILVATENMN
mgnify:CR=1 FL=1